MSTRRPATLPRPAPTGTAPSDDGTGRRPRIRLFVLAAVVVVATLLGWSMTGRPNPLAKNASTEPTTMIPIVEPPTATGGIVWRDFAGLSLPVSSNSGPRCTDDRRARCFTRTDDGAALAAVHLLVRTFPFAGAAVFGPTIRGQVTGRDAEAFARLTAEAYGDVAPAAGVTNGEPIPSEGGWVAGYRLELPSGVDRTVDVLIRQTDSDGQTGFTEYAVQLRWQQDDWVLVAPPWGDWRNAARSVPAPDRTDYLTYDGIA